MNSALHGASLSPDNVIPAKAGIQAPGLFLVLKTTPDKTHVVLVERVPEKTGKWNPGPWYRHINHAGHRRGASGFRPPACAGAGFAGMTWGGVNMDTPKVAVPCRQRCTPAARSAAEGYCPATSTKI